MSDPRPNHTAEAASDGAEPPHEGPPPTERPVLASEVLKDDMAPVRPLARTARAVCLGAGAIFALLAVAPALGLPLGSLDPRQIAVHVVLAALALAGGVLGGWYEQRAGLMLLVGIGCAGLGMVGMGPAAAAEEITGEWGVLVLLTAVGLPAALLFRAHYRALRAARLVLAGALALSIPFAAHGVLRAIDVSDLALQIANGVAVGSVVVSLLGFMGEETTGAGIPLAALVTVAMAGVLATETLMGARGLRPMQEALGPLVSILAFVCGAFLASLGVFGLLAWRFAPQARAVDPRSRPIHDKRPRPSMGGWLSRR